MIQNDKNDSREISAWRSPLGGLRLEVKPKSGSKPWLQLFALLSHRVGLINSFTKNLIYRRIGLCGHVEKLN